MQYVTSFTGTSLVSVTNRLVAPRARLLAAGLALVATVLAGCSGGSGAPVEVVPGAGNGPAAQTYTGPAPSTADVQAFKINLWDNIHADNRCGTCHSVSGGQTPMFARSDDVNLAYAAANQVVDLASPKDSMMVQKVGGGHNCWLASNAACASILTTWITNWAGSTATGGDRKIQLEPPVIRDPGTSKNFPDDQGLLYSTTVYPIVSQFCARCHSSSSSVKQQPFFAEGPTNNAMAVQAAYEAAKPKMELDDPANSRFVLRLRNESHNCWTASCTNDANAMQAAITQFAAGITPTQVDPNLFTSKATTLYEGTVASGGHRDDSNVIALYEFKTGQTCGQSITGACATAYDTSGVDPAMDLTLSGNVQWFGGWGLNFAGGKAQASTGASAKLKRLASATGEYSIEAWVTPGNVVQEDMRIVSYSAGLMQRNFNLGQTMYNYDFFNRSDKTDANGNPQLSTPDAAEVLQASLQHVVATFDPATGRKIYVNGVLVASNDPAPGGLLNDWDDTFAFVLGNEVSGTRMWSGVIRLVAIHNRALTPAQIQQNFQAGVGEKYFLMFSVEHLTNVPESFVVFEASQFDSYSYLFRKPFFISLDDTQQPDMIDVRGLRVGINGGEAAVGQAYANMDTQITTALYSTATGQPLADLGTVLPLEKGPDSDEFFLTFDKIASHTFNRPAPATPPPPTAVDLPPASAIGVHTFDQISATMAAITGVSQLDSSVSTTFGTIRQSLPADADIKAVLASHQVAIAQLAIGYCDALMENRNTTIPRDTMFAGFNFSGSPASAFASENLLFDPLLNRVLGVTQLASQPDKNAVRTELHQQVNGIPGDATRPGLLNTSSDTSSARTRNIAKAVCSAVIGSAAMLVQ
jgi:Concanavalin A-like lectin/glucanases superfamily